MGHMKSPYDDPDLILIGDGFGAASVSSGNIERRSWELLPERSPYNLKVRSFHGTFNYKLKIRVVE